MNNKEKLILLELEKFINDTNYWVVEFKPEEKIIKKSYICVQDLKNKINELKEKYNEISNKQK